MQTNSQSDAIRNSSDDSSDGSPDGVPDDSLEGIPDGVPFDEIRRLANRSLVFERPTDDDPPEYKKTYEYLLKNFGRFGENRVLARNRAGDIIDMGDIDEVMSSAVLEDSQYADSQLGVSHRVKFSTLFDMWNSEPGLSQSLNIASEVPTAYGSYFAYEPVPREFRTVANPPFVPPSVEYWNRWAEFVQFKHFQRQFIHSLLGTGNMWAEKVYDRSGMVKKGWGVRKLKVLSPDVMYNVVDEKGRILKFVQYSGDSDRSLGKDMIITERQAEEMKRKAAEESTLYHEIPRHKVIYCNYNAYYDDSPYGFGRSVPNIAYARSKIGIQKKILRIVENASISMVVFTYGNENFMVSGKSATKTFANIKGKQHLKFVLLPFTFQPKEIELGKNVANFEGYLRYFQQELMIGAGLPPFYFGMGTGESAKIQMELLVRQFMFTQQIFSDVCKSQLFAECVLGDPSKTKKIMTDDPRQYPYMRPSMFVLLPTLRHNTIESVADRRLRHDTYGKLGMLSNKEMRSEIDRYGSTDMSDLTPSLKLEQRRLDIEERKLDIEEKKIKASLKVAEASAKAAQSTTKTADTPATKTDAKKSANTASK